MRKFDEKADNSRIGLSIFIQHNLSLVYLSKNSFQEK